MTKSKHKKTIPYNSQSNIPIMYTTSSSLAYRAFATTFKAMEANFFCLEHVLQLPGLCRLEHGAPDKKEFVAKENLNFNGNKPKGSVSHNVATTNASNITCSKN